MHSYLDAKTMAKTLRESLKQRQIDLSHSESLELVAKQFGLADWNTLAARIGSAVPDKPVLPLPQDWFIAGKTDIGDYRAGLDPGQPNTALIESCLKRGEGADLDSSKFAVLMQSITAEGYRGQKLRLRASLRSEDADLGTIWMRIDGQENTSLRFDNMTRRPADGPLKGTTDWSERQVVLDVPAEADSIHFGLFLEGHGRLWARHFRLEIVGADVPTTSGQGRHLSGPANLDFAKVMPAKQN